MDGNNHNYHTLNTGSYVVVSYDGSLFPGIIQDLAPDEVQVNVMHSCRGGWKWPKEKDCIWYSPLLHLLLRTPVPLNNRDVY